MINHMYTETRSKAGTRIVEDYIDVQEQFIDCLCKYIQDYMVTRIFIFLFKFFYKIKYLRLLQKSLEF